MSKVVYFRGLGLVIAMSSVTGLAKAQFHQQSKTGTQQQIGNSGAYTGASRSGATVTNADGSVSASPQPGMQGGVTSNGSGSIGKNHFSTIYLSEAYRKAGVKMGEQEDLKITKWGRAVHHSDGSYTQSVCQEGAQLMEQETRSKNGVILQRRVVTLDQYSRAKEVMIYDGRDKFKYRGILLYDQQGRFREEQLFSPDETLIRRKIQEYALDGTKLPSRSVDYVENVPDDLQLVITHESEEEFKYGKKEDKPQRGSDGNFFNNRQKSQPDSGVTTGPAPTQPAGAGGTAAGNQKKSMGANLGRFFKNRNK